MLKCYWCHPDARIKIHHPRCLQKRKLKQPAQRRQLERHQSLLKVELKRKNREIKIITNWKIGKIIYKKIYSLRTCARARLRKRNVIGTGGAKSTYPGV